MGNSSGKKGSAQCIPEMQRLSYDLSPLQDLKVPYIWLVGPGECGRDHEASILEENYGFDIIKICNLLKRHSSNDTDRGRVIKENLDKPNRKIPDTIILDILKEEMISKAKFTTGFILNGFPRNRLQAEMFVNEIAPVDVIIVLKCSTNSLVERILLKNEFAKRAEVKAQIRKCQNEIRESLKHFSAKIETFDTTTETPDEIFPRIQSALNVRVFGEVGNKLVVD